MISKKILALVLALSVIVCTLPMGSVFAANTSVFPYTAETLTFTEEELSDATLVYMTTGLYVDFSKASDSFKAMATSKADVTDKIYMSGKFTFGNVEVNITDLPAKGLTSSGALNFWASSFAADDAELAAKMAAAGFSFEEAVEKLEELKMTSRIFFTTGDLSYLQKGGRIGKVLTQAASMLKIKPIIHLYEGELQAAGIARARKKSIAKFMEDARAFFADKNINDYRICTGKGHDKDEYDAFHKEVQEEMKALGFTGEVESYQIGCTIGVHTGPTPIGIACIRKFDA